MIIKVKMSAIIIKEEKARLKARKNAQKTADTRWSLPHDTICFSAREVPQGL